MTRVLVVGGAGYIGGYLTDILMLHAFEVMVYDDLWYEERYFKDVRFVRGDIRNRVALDAAMKDFNPDIVVWLAALVGDPACALNPELAEQLNVESLKQFAETYDTRVIFTSTCSVYGINHDLIDENAVPAPLSVYASTKLAAEKHLLALRPPSDVLILRLGTLYGPGDLFSRIRMDLVVNSFAVRALKGHPLMVYGGNQWRPLLHVRDVARAIVHGIKHEVSGLYNLVGENLQIVDLAWRIVHHLGKGDVVQKDMPAVDQRNYRVKGVKFGATGWEPRSSLEEGIDQIQRLVEEGRVKDVFQSVYSNAEFLKGRI
jgi:nucleoside-diphosphate-sugar epimerase